MREVDWGAVVAKVHDGAEMDDVDRGIVARRQATFDAMEGPRTGDYVIFADGVTRRISHVWWDETAQTSDGGSWYFTGGHMSFSGGLWPGVPISSLVDTGERRDARAWIFHHDCARAGGGVDVDVTVRVYQCSHPSNTYRVDSDG